MYTNFITGFTPKIVIQCEGEKVVSRIPLELNEKNEWETKSDFEQIKVTFYRKKPHHPIIMEVCSLYLVYLESKIKLSEE